MFENVESFCRPATVREAVQLLQSGNGSARIIAGCTDVIVEGDASVRCLIDLSRVGLSYIRRRGANWSIGATTTMAAIERSAVLRVMANGLLCQAASTCGSVQIRNMATVGGNMAHGSPSADTATPFLALNAFAVLADSCGRRRIPLTEYLLIARSKEMRHSLLVELSFAEPPRRPYCGWSFQKFGRTEVDISLANVAAGLQFDTRGRIKSVRIALGAVAASPIRAAGAEALMLGHMLDQRLLTQACDAVTREIAPIDDVRASAEYRRELTRVLTGRAIEECAVRAGYGL